MHRLPAICLLVMLACTVMAHAAADYDGWWPDPYEVADEQQQAERNQRNDELTPEQRRALHEYLAKHADRDGDGDAVPHEPCSLVQVVRKTLRSGKISERSNNAQPIASGNCERSSCPANR